MQKCSHVAKIPTRAQTHLRTHQMRDDTLDGAHSRCAMIV